MTSDTNPDRTEAILRAAYAGETYSQIGQRYGISRQRVGSIIARADPDFISPNIPKPRPVPIKTCGAPCGICDEQVCPPRIKYCSEEHADVGRLWKEVTEYRPGRMRAYARYLLKGDKEPQKRWATRYLNDETPGDRWLIEGSATYDILETYGLIEYLPPDIEVIYKTPEADRFRRRLAKQVMGREKVGDSVGE